MQRQKNIKMNNPILIKMEESSEEPNIAQMLKKSEENEETSEESIKSIPSKKEALQLLNKLGLPHHIINHLLAVMRKARDIAHNIVKHEINIELVKIGALLHDIGRVRGHGLEHAAHGGDLLRELGYSDELARMAETHTLGGITEEEAKELELPIRDYLPRSIEEKIVCLADKYISGSDKVEIDQRFSRWIEKYGESDFLSKQIQRVRAIEEEILHLIHD
jgi:uncharacterized protein